jgi:hypothetical protein
MIRKERTSGMRMLCGQAMANGPRKAHPILETGKRRARADAQPTEPAASATRRDLLERSAFALMGNIKSSFIEDASSTPSRFLELLEEELEVAKADRMQNWIRMPTMQYNSDCCNLVVTRRINRENAFLSDDDKKALRLKRLRPVWDLMSEIFQFC